MEMRSYRKFLSLQRQRNGYVVGMVWFNPNLNLTRGFLGVLGLIKLQGL